MPRVTMKEGFSVIGEFPEADKEVTFQVPSPTSDQDIRVTLDCQNGEVLATGIFEVSDELLTQLPEARSTGDLPNDERDEIRACMDEISDAAREVIGQLKYRLGWKRIHEELISSSSTFSWETDHGESGDIFPIVMVDTMIRFAEAPLNRSHIQEIQSFIDDRNEPFVAYRFLHRAFQPRMPPKYSWVHATIAAELAIKEFLIRKFPEAEALVLEVPAPPLYKLYGRILEELVGERSPSVSEIAEGAGKQNEILHRPEEHSISLSEANEYAHDVREAIEHLESLLD